jgi:hypothetical protein
MQLPFAMIKLSRRSAMSSTPMLACANGLVAISPALLLPFG